MHCVKNTPRPLCGLTKEAAAALQILEVDCGVYLRPDHGYRVHTALVRLLWVKESVEARIAALPLRADRRHARAALAFLAESEDSEYRLFLAKHRDFLRQNPEADVAARPPAAPDHGGARRRVRHLARPLPRL